MLAVFKSENLRSIADFTISSLAFLDFTVCSTYLPFLIYEVKKHNLAFNIARDFFGHCSLTVSVTNMFVVTVDRVIAIRFPLKYPAIMTIKTVKSVISLVLLISLIFGAVYATEMSIFQFILLSYCIILMLCIMSMYYIFYAAKKTKKKSSTPEFFRTVTCICRATQATEGGQESSRNHFYCCWNLCLVLVAIVSSSRILVNFKKIRYCLKRVSIGCRRCCHVILP